MAEVKIIPETIQFLRLSDEEYFSEKYKEYLSNSKISLINPDEGGSIDKFLKGFSEEYSDSYALGSAVHCKILQEEDFIISDLTKPNGKLGIFTEEVHKFRCLNHTLKESFEKASIKANYYQNKLSPTRLKSAIRGGLPFYLKRFKMKECSNTIFLSDSLYDKYIGAKESLLNNGNVMNLLKPEGFLETPEVYNEYAILCHIDFMNDNGEFITLPFKAKIDNFTIDHEQKIITLNDLKTTGKPINYFMGNNVEQESGMVWYDGSFQKYRYYRQVAVYMWLLQAALQVVMPHIIGYTFKSNIIVVESFPEFKSGFFRVPNSSIKQGLKEFKKLLSYIAAWKIN